MKVKSPVLLLAGVLLLILSVVIGFMNGPKLNLQKDSILQTVNTKEFKSSGVMDFTIRIPHDYQIIEKFGSVTISGPSGEILLAQNGTNYTNLADYIDDSRNNLKSKLYNRKNLTIERLEATSGFIEQEKFIFIYAEYNVYILSAKNADLYDDLDQIAQTFQYTP